MPKNMPRLNQVIAVEKGEKSRAHRVETDLYHLLQTPQRFSGHSKIYTPKDEEGETQPPNHLLVQLTCDKCNEDLVAALKPLFDIVATKEWGNTKAVADVVVDGEVILSNVPVTYLLFLEKELEKLRTYIGKLPILDPSEKWTYNPTCGFFASSPTWTNSTKKVKKGLILAPATDKHPAQSQMIEEDIVVGTWNTTKFSGAVYADDVKALSTQVEKLQDAVKVAREQANSLEVEAQEVGEALLKFIFS